MNAITDEIDWDTRYGEFIETVYAAALGVVQDWGLKTEVDIYSILDDGLADDLWKWVEVRVPTRSDEVRAVHDNDLSGAVEVVLSRHLWHDRWRLSDNPDDPDDDEANGWVGPARDELARAIEESVLLRHDGDPAWAESNFEDLRDYCLWQWMLDMARREQGGGCELGFGCECTCHTKNPVASGA